MQKWSTLQADAGTDLPLVDVHMMNMISSVIIINIFLFCEFDFSILSCCYQCSAECNFDESLKNTP